MIIHIKKINSHRSSFAKIMLFFAVVFCFIQSVWGANQQDGNTWFFDKVSSVNLFGKNDPEMTLQLKKMYGGVSVNTNGNVFTVNNLILEGGTVCKIKYVSISKSALSYYSSEKTVSMYKKLFKSEGLLFPDNIKVLTALDPDIACPEPYNELVEINNLLIFSDQDYVLFLKRNESDETNTKFPIKGKDLNSYCKNDKNIKEYDGTSNTICFFKGLSL